MLRELIKSLYAIANAIKGNNSEGGGNNDNVENNYIKFIQPVGIIRVVRNATSETQNIGSVIIDEYEPISINDGGYLTGDANTFYYLVYNRADIENGVNDKFGYGYYKTDSNTELTVYLNRENFINTTSLIEFLQGIKSEQVNPKFDEINSSIITESNLENFVTSMVSFSVTK